MKKEDSLNQSNKARNFWLCAGLLVVLLASIMTRDINRPFYGLHSWAEAHGAWLGRVHLKYGLAYTKGLRTWAVGEPPTANPHRYLDHPQLSALLNAGVMAILGINEWALRVAKIITGIASLLIFLRILKALVDVKTALLAGLLYALFPLTGYFGVGGWVTLAGFCALWCYLVLIGALKDGPKPKPFHKWGLAASLFLMIQVSWAGFFYAFVIGSHYVFRCIHRRQFPEKNLLAILIIAPLASLVLAFGIMAAGYEWDFSKIAELYKWRAAKGEMAEFVWSKWFAQLWEFAVTNYTLPILITAIAYLTFGQLFVFMETEPSKKNERRSRQFPQLWLFLMPGVFLLLVFKGLVWRHQYWQRPLSPAIAIAAAMGIMLLADILKKVHRRLPAVAIVSLIGIFSVSCMIGTNYYYGIRWQPLARIDMLKLLNSKIPPDKALLSREMRTYFVKQHEAKGGHYRPEIAWYLDRDIEQATTLTEIQSLAGTGKYPYYLIPKSAPWSQQTAGLVQWARQPNLTAAERARREQLARQERFKEVQKWQNFIDSLKELYQYQQISGEQGETKDGKFFRAGMRDHLIFDLNSSVSAPTGGQ